MKKPLIIISLTLFMLIISFQNCGKINKESLSPVKPIPTATPETSGSLQCGQGQFETGHIYTDSENNQFCGCDDLHVWEHASKKCIINSKITTLFI